MAERLRRLKAPRPTTQIKVMRSAQGLRMHGNVGSLLRILLSGVVLFGSRLVAFQTRMKRNRRPTKTTGPVKGCSQVSAKEGRTSGLGLRRWFRVWMLKLRVFVVLGCR